jgi:ATP-dependent DNA helicase RecG
MFATSLQEGKLPPDFSATRNESVSVVLHGSVQDETFVAFLERVARQKQQAFHVADLLVLDAVHRGLDIPDDLRNRVTTLLSLGAIERVGRSKLVLARQFYVLKGKPGEYTRRKGLDRETRKQLLIQHIAACAEIGAPLEELAQVLPEASRNELKVLLREIRRDGRAHVRGVKRAARWFGGGGR